MCVNIMWKWNDLSRVIKTSDGRKNLGEWIQLQWVSRNAQNSVYTCMEQSFLMHYNIYTYYWICELNNIYTYYWISEYIQ